jgi:hypothetical protein
MTLLEMLNALPEVQKLMNLKLPVKKAFKVYSLAKQINEQRDFFINEEKKLIEKFQAIVDEGGRVSFNSAEDQEGFLKEHNELKNYVPEGIEVLELSFADLGDAEFTPMELATLEGVISFID